MKIIITFLLLMVSYSSTFANSCRVPDRDEVEVIYVNGIDTDNDGFEKNVITLKNGLLKDYPKFNKDISVHNGTFGRPLDIVQSLSQLEQSFYYENAGNDYKKMRIDLSTIAFLLTANAVGVEKLKGYFSSGDAYQKSVEKIGDMESLIKNSALGSEFFTKILRDKYVADAKLTFEQAFSKTLPEVHSDLMPRLYNLIKNNKPFILLGHSQGTIIVNQASTILRNSIIDSKRGYQKDLFGRYEIASMNPWSSDDIASSKADYIVLYTDWVQDLVDKGLRFQTAGEIDPVNESDPFIRHLEADRNLNNRIIDYWLYWDKSDKLGHSVDTYVKTFPNLTQRSVERLDNIRKSLRVCDEPEEAKVVKQSLRGCQNGVLHQNLTGGFTINFNAGQISRPVSLYKKGSMKSMKVYENGTLVSVSANPFGDIRISFPEGGWTTVTTTEDNYETDNIVSVVVEEADGYSYDVGVYCP